MRSITGGASSNEFSNTDLNQLERQLVTWRRRQPGRTRLPANLWEAAAELARCLGVSQVSRRLRLDYYKLSRWAAQAHPKGGPPKTPFVELVLAGPGQADGGQEFRAETGGPGGSRLTLHLGRNVSAVVALAEAFWRRQP